MVEHKTYITICDHAINDSKDEAEYSANHFADYLKNTYNIEITDVSIKYINENVELGDICDDELGIVNS